MSNPLIVKRLQIFLCILMIFGSSACKKKGPSVNELYKFPDTKDVRVEVNISYKLAPNVGPAVSLINQEFLLDAYLLDENGSKQVDIGRLGESIVTDLPVTLSATDLKFDAMVRLPASARPGPDGYAFHFALKDKASLGLAGSSETIKNLDTLTGSVHPGTSASTNKVILSLATTIAFNLMTSSGINGGVPSQIVAYKDLIAALDERVKSYELLVKSDATPDLATYVAAVLAAVKLDLIKDSVLQQKVFDTLKAVAPANSTIASSFDATILGYVQEVKATLGVATSDESKLFTVDSIDTAAIPDPATYISPLSSPGAITFSDSDQTSALGGDIAFVSARNPAGILSYNIYFGGATAADSRISLIGNVSTSGELKFALPSGTAIPLGATHFWVFPVYEKGEVAMASSLLINNVINGSEGAVTPTSLVATAGSRLIENVWAAGGGGTVGYVLVRRKGAAVTWVPSNGQTYVEGTSDPDHVISYVGTALHKTDRHLETDTYHYALYAFNSAHQYAEVLRSHATIFGAMWTWMAGEITDDVVAMNRGTKGVAAVSNHPGRRSAPVVCGKGGVFWLFGGGALGYPDLYNDLWKFEAGLWTWVAGTDQINHLAVYGTKGVANTANVPGARILGACAIDSHNNFVMYSGEGYGTTNSTSVRDEVWKFDGTNWTWLAGNNDCTTGNLCFTVRPPTPGTSSADATPGGRSLFAAAMDSLDRLWVYGGAGYTDSSSKSNLNDLWMFDGSVWTWASGSGGMTRDGVYGTLGEASASTQPGGRNKAKLFVDSQDRIWLSGGDGFGESDSGLLNDVFRFSNGQWTWIAGNKTARVSGIPGVLGVYGNKGVADAANHPGSRYHHASWVDADNNVWIFGGIGRDSTNPEGYLNDLWKFDGTNWTWMSGSNTRNVSAFEGGTMGVPNSNNTPFVREVLASSLDAAGNLFMFGAFPPQVRFTTPGFPYGTMDLWRYTP